MTLTPAQIRHIEEQAATIWPALKRRYYDGWVLNFANGYTRRANSVHPLYSAPGSTLTLDEKIAHCEAGYRAQRLPPVFKLTDAALPADLDDQLVARGYTRDDGTFVQHCPLTAHDPQPDPTLKATIRTMPDERWLAESCRLSGSDPATIPAMRGVLDQVVGQTACLSLWGAQATGPASASGLAILLDGDLWLFSIVTDHAQRGRGLGKQVMLHLLRWGIDHGATAAYLQVRSTNPPALRLYAGLGFETLYSYWYRTPPPT
ncbi:MAG: GNAT family N-acetyltransferase [Chloroflexi bacterium]|nr:GNAT family N-acetyltransferase [Chloroflexota bacterium]